MDAVNKKYEGSISQTTPVWKNEKNEIAERPANYKDNTTLTMDDFYALMAAEMQYQDVLNPESNTAEMMNQMVQMSMINAIQDMMTMSMTTYAGSLMGKEVIIADTSTGKIETISGVVEGVNLYSGTPTIIVNGKEYSMAQIMGLGKAPETSKPEEKPDPDDSDDGVGDKDDVNNGGNGSTGGDDNTVGDKDDVNNGGNGGTGSEGSGNEQPTPPVTEGNGNEQPTPPVTEGNGNEQPTPPVTEGNGNEQPTPPVTEGNGNEQPTPPVTESNGNEQPTPPVTEGNGNEQPTPPVTEGNGNEEQTPPTTGDGGEQA